MKKLLNKIFLIINLILIVVLFFSYLASHVNPSKTWVIAFFGLAYPQILIANIIFIILWFFRKPKYALISIITILLGWQYFSRSFQINFSKEKSEFENENTNDFKLLTYNVRLFDLYNWTKQNNSPDEIFEFTASQNPDIFCFQEFVSNSSNTARSYKYVANHKMARYSHFAYTKSNRNLYYGVVTYSKYPIINRGEIRFDDTKNISIFSDIKINSDTIRLYNLHLQSIRFDLKNYHYLDTMSFKYDEENIAQIEDITKRMKIAYQKRSDQVAIVSAHMKKSPYKIVICGDFNDTPVSYTYSELIAELLDAFVESGHGFENSFTGIFPSFRIDYIFHDEKIQSYDYQTIKVDFSDHFPVSCRLVLD
ncbi:MAG: endonuclease/exonuclease/phosphatase family protein [Bacteroidetes bacterium]|nr:endonuclease/exonuclease/phosphatase family protein [Bacteroidota bacterium]MBT6687805.1 endonuclease/exonuclease/phosphatase family protein [Bacteroidota bacterium]MBT7143474.1 endonuclease/exonuclease/phosphatase family protein [Bacteroidota bacterium]MBT7493140.1 endonuclease/exonuclease/phosphatase family protein [Bacteroidota bacterium]